MTVPELLASLQRQVPPDAPTGTRWKGQAVVAGPLGRHEVAAAARIDPQGRQREQFWCDGFRVERAVLLRLTCPEAECPQAQQVRAQWAAFRRQGRGLRPPVPAPLQPLLAEVPVVVGPQRFTARPARFPCFTPCPHGAHPPMTLDKQGFDLFDEHQCLGGGVTESGGVRRPRIPSVRAAEAYVLARHLETLATVNRARASSRRRPGTGPDGE